MRSLLLILRNLRFHWRTNLCLLVGTAIASAILTGALLVGDSVKGTLREQALARLGDVLFAAESPGRFMAETGVDAPSSIAPVLRLAGMAIGRDRQVNTVQVLGVDCRFWQTGLYCRESIPPDQIFISSNLGDALGLNEGDEVALRVANPSMMPFGTPLSLEDARSSVRHTFRVGVILPDKRMGRFDLASEQMAPYNVFLDLNVLQQMVDLDEHVNLVLSTGAYPFIGPTFIDPPGDAARWLAGAGLLLREPEGTGIVQLESERAFIDSVVGNAALEVEGAVGAFTYLVNGISHGGRRTPYSFMTALVSSTWGVVPAGMGDDEIIVNRWTADELSVKPGDAVTVAYYKILPPSRYEKRRREFTVRSIVEMKDVEIERELVPDFPGLSDVDSCADWDVGMPMDEEDLADEANEAYWKEYRQTPKAFVTLAAGQEMWGSHFGNLTGVRFTGSAPHAVAAALVGKLDPASLGIVVRNVRREALEAVERSMDFGGLFLGMSFFLIAAALGLTAMLFGLGIRSRSEEIGTLRALGYTAGRVSRLLLAEGATVALVGAGLGGLLGTLYTRAMIALLATRWRGAVAGTSIEYHVGAQSVRIGAGVSFVAAAIAVAFIVYRSCRRSPRALLAGGDSGDTTPIAETKSGHVPGILGLLSGLGAAVVIVASGAAPTAFFGAGFLLLISLIAVAALLLRRMDGDGARLSIAGAGRRGATRSRGRSLTVMGLIAAGCFLLVGVSCMVHDLSHDAGDRSSPTGGFELFGESTLPITEDLDSSEGRKALRLDREPALEGMRAVGLKLLDGDDASCLNLNRARQPRLLGVDPAEMAALGAFVTPGNGRLWQKLSTRQPDGSIPALVGDRDTANWGLERGETIDYVDERGQKFEIRKVGSLPMRLTVFQGSLLVDTTALAARYPSIAGDQVFLFDVPAGQEAAAREALTRRLGDLGMDVRTTVERIETFYRVERTYLSVFLMLGGLGLLLGTAGLGIMLLHNALERRGELALLRAVGYSRGEVARLLLAEHNLLLLAGVVAGTVAATVAIWPSLREMGASLPLGTVGLFLGGILLSGMTMTAAAARIATRGEPLDALREE